MEKESINNEAKKKEDVFNKYTCYQCDDFIGCPDRPFWLRGINYEMDMQDVGCFKVKIDKRGLKNEN